MTSENFADALDRAEASLDRGASLKGTGFWKAVAVVRRDPGAAPEVVDRIAAIDTRAFAQGVKLKVSEGVGTEILMAGTAGGVAIVLSLSRLEDPLVRSAGLLVSYGVLVVSTHSLAHWVVGRLVGIKFTHYFLGGPPPPRPGVKSDYASYLRTAPRKRALMHASGAVVTKILPFLVAAAGPKLRVRGWAVGTLLGIGVVQIVTDVVFSTKNSDWMKVSRELRAAREMNSRSS